MRYFAYGANLNPSNFWYRCPGAQFIGPTKLQDHSFFIDTFGVASVKKCIGSVVYGVTWEISKSDEESLDNYEGVSQGHYTKEIIKIDDIDTLVYISSDKRTGSGRSSYMRDIIINADTHDFPIEYIRYLEKLFNT
jgi:hypothetical protein